MIIRREALIRGRRLIQCGYVKVQRLLEGGSYLRPGAYQREYGKRKEKGICTPLRTPLLMLQILVNFATSALFMVWRSVLLLLLLQL